MAPGRKFFQPANFDLKIPHSLATCESLFLVDLIGYEDHLSVGLNCGGREWQYNVLTRSSNSGVRGPELCPAPPLAS